MKKLILTFIILFASSVIFAQPVENWANFIGQTVYRVNTPLAINLELDDHGNSYVAGVNNNGAFNVFMAKYDINGTLIWIVNTSTNNWFPKGCVMKRSGKYLYLAYEHNPSIITEKYDTDGNLIWQAVHGYIVQSYPMAMTVDKHAKVYIACCEVTSTTTDYVILKYDKNGNPETGAVYNNGSYEEPAAIAVDKFQNIYVTGTSWGTVSHDYATVKFGVDGLIQWVARYNGPANSGDGTTCLEIDDDDVYVTGQSILSSTSSEIVTIKYDKNGNMLWTKTYTHSNLRHLPYGLAVDDDKNVYVTGGDGNQMALIKYDLNGNVSWVQTHPGDKGYSLILDARQQNVYITSDQNMGGGVTDGITIKYDVDGNQIWEKYYDRGVGGSDVPVRIKTDSDCGVYIAGNSQDSNGIFENFILKYDECSSPRPLSVNNTSEIPTQFNLYQNYPNPFNPSTKIKFDVPAKGSCKITLRVYDLIGREVATLLNQEVQPGTHEVEFDGSNLASGIYFYRIDAEGSAMNFSKTLKMILAK